jgi:hypothetical protein
LENIFTSCENPPHEDKLPLRNSIEHVGDLSHRDSATLGGRLAKAQRRYRAACEMNVISLKRVS